MHKLSLSLPRAASPPHALTLSFSLAVAVTLRVNQRALRATANFNTPLMMMAVCCCSFHIERIHRHTHTSTSASANVSVLVLCECVCPCHIACYFNHNWLNSKFQRETHPLLCSIYTQRAHNTQYNPIYNVWKETLLYSHREVGINGMNGKYIFRLIK